ncbi:MAG: hypothetical protein NZM28_06355 [Fimbriimonadales bacterium]|nr:hypothetical protein [Fimbriimonadales bacterium]
MGTNKAQILAAWLQMTDQERRELLEELQAQALSDARPVATTHTRSLRQRLQAAAEALQADYLTDPELTAFSALDGEDWHETGRGLAD